MALFSLIASLLGITLTLFLTLMQVPGRNKKAGVVILCLIAAGASCRLFVSVREHEKLQAYEARSHLLSLVDAIMNETGRSREEVKRLVTRLGEEGARNYLFDLEIDTERDRRTVNEVAEVVRRLEEAAVLAVRQELPTVFRETCATGLDAQMADLRGSVAVAAQLIEEAGDTAARRIGGAVGKGVTRAEGLALSLEASFDSLETTVEQFQVALLGDDLPVDSEGALVLLDSSVDRVSSRVSELDEELKTIQAIDLLVRDFQYCLSTRFWRKRSCLEDLNAKLGGLAGKTALRSGGKRAIGLD